MPIARELKEAHGMDSFPLHREQPPETAPTTSTESTNALSFMCPEHSMREKMVFSTNGAGITRYTYAKEKG